MPDHLPQKPSKAEIPGLAYFIPETPKPRKVERVATKAATTDLEQMYDYYAA